MGPELFDVAKQGGGAGLATQGQSYDIDVRERAASLVALMVLLFIFVVLGPWILQALGSWFPLP